MKSQTIADLVVAQVGVDGSVVLANHSTGATDLLVDVDGYVTGSGTDAAGTTWTDTAARILDTSAGTGAPRGVVPPGGSVQLAVRGRGSVPLTGVAAVYLDVTVTQSHAHGHLTVHPTAQPDSPASSDLYFANAQPVTVLAISALGADGGVTLVNHSTSPVQLSADVAGYVLADAPAPLDWAGPQVALQPRGSVFGLSCPTTTFCAATDSDGNVLVDRAGWSYPQPSGVPHLAGVSCVSESFCLAVGYQQSVTYDGSTWSAPVSVPDASSLTAVSCASVQFCAAVDEEGAALVYDGTSWIRTPDLVSAPFADVSCPSASFCMATDVDGRTATYDNGGWHGSGTAFAFRIDHVHVGCGSRTFCVAVGDSFFARWDGRTWHEPVVGNGNILYGVSCPEPTSCTSILGSTATEITPTAVTPGASGGVGGPNALSCASATRCVDAGPYGYPSISDDAAVLDHGAWSTPVVIDQPDSAALSGLSCPEVNFCLATDDTGFAATWDGTAWAHSVPADTTVDTGSTEGIGAASCASADFCLWANLYDDASVYRNGVWKVVADAPLDVSAISCVTSTFCVAVDNTSSAAVFNGTTWSGRVVIDPDTNDLSDVSCASTKFCVVSDGSSSVVTYVNGVWQAPLLIGPDESYLTGVSCASTSFCMAVDRSGRSLTYDGRSWGDPAPVADGSYLSSVSCAAGTLTCAATGSGTVYLLGPSGATAAHDVGDSYGVRDVACSVHGAATSAPVCLVGTSDGLVRRGS